MATWDPSLANCLLSFIFILCQLANSTGAQAPTNWTTFPFNPPSLPLAVKNPYLNAWAPLAGGSAAINQAAPRSYLPLTNQLEWYASIRVDGIAYKLLGGEDSLSNVSVASQKGFTFTPTQTVYTLDCGGKVSVNMTFVTPIEAADLVRLSSPFSYLQVIASSSDGQPHNVQVYSDVSGAWIAGDLSQVSGWAVDDSDGFKFVSLQRQLKNPIPFTENVNRPQDATVYYAAQKSNSLSWQIGPSRSTRLSFANGTKLSSSIQTGEDAIGPPSDTNTILGLAIDLGTVSSKSNPAVFALGIVRDPVVQYTNSQGKTENRTAYYWLNFTNVNNLLADVVDHFPDALASANALDASLSQAAQPYGSDYTNLLSLSTRQAMGAIEYTIPKDTGSNESSALDIKAFMKDMGYVGTADTGLGDQGSPSSVNPVDVMFAAMPAYLYLNPNILGYLLRPLLEFQDSNQYQNPFAAPNLGTSYPNATGNTKAHNQGIEQTANMLIMGLAHAQTSGDDSLLSKHYGLLSRWGSYLVDFAMNPQQQVTSLSDALSNKLGSVNNQTNLALKGIIGIGAMAKIAEAVNRTDDAQRFNSTAIDYASQWRSLAIHSGQPTVSFTSSDPGFLYNLFADKLLGLDLIDKTVYDDFTAVVSLETSTLRFGVPLEISSSMARADWILFAAAIMVDEHVRTSLISQVANYNSQSLLGANMPFPVVYNASSGEQGPVGQGSPAVGAMYAPLALTMSKKIIGSNSTAGSNGNGSDSGTTGNDNTDSSGGSSSKHISNGAIAGIAIGGVALIGGFMALTWVLRRRHTFQEDRPAILLDMDEIPRASGQHGTGAPDVEAEIHAYTYGTTTPFYPSNAALLAFRDSGASASHGPSSNTSLPNPYSVAGESVDPSSTDASPTRSSNAGGAQSSTSGGDSRLLSEVERLREEVERMKSAVEQGHAPPPGYYETLPADESLPESTHMEESTDTQTTAIHDSISEPDIPSKR